MAIFSRFVRLVKADVHGVMDCLEDKGLILSQCLREMEEEMDRAAASLAADRSARAAAVKEMEKLDAEEARLNEDLAMAVKKEKDDAARFLIRKRKNVRFRTETLSEREKGLGERIDNAARALEDRKLHYEKLKVRAERFFSMKKDQDAWQAAESAWSGANVPDLADEEVEIELARVKDEILGGATS